MVSTPEVSDATKGAAGGAVGAIAADAVIGLERAAAVAGDVLRGIFGGLPWEMSWQAIVDAVGGGSAQAGVLLPDLATVVVA